LSFIALFVGLMLKSKFIIRNYRTLICPQKVDVSDLENNCPKNLFAMSVVLAKIY